LPNLSLRVYRPTIHVLIRLSAAASALALALTGNTTNAALIWNEQANGDFSDDRFAPTPLLLAEGSNEVFARIEAQNIDGNLDLDYYSITIPQGYRLAQVILDTYLSTDFAAFMGIQPGPIFPNDPATVEPGDLLGYLHFGPDLQGLDMLPLMGANGQGFAPPLPAGTYTLWVQQVGDFTEYAPNFIVEQVPAPGSLSALMTAMVIGTATRRRRVS